jgi:predicted transposase/invertase (TIGR01784 family)
MVKENSAMNNKSSLMNPQVDYVFKNIFGNKSHPKILISLLNAIFGYVGDSPKKITKVTIENPNITKSIVDGKYSILDIRAIANDNEIINIEMQIKNEYNIKERSMYHLSKMFSGQLKAGDNYTVLKKSVVICILNYNLFNSDNTRIHNKFLFKNTETNEDLSDLMELHYIELRKLHQNKDMQLNDLLIDWLLFLTNPESEVISMVKKKVPEIEEAISLLDILSKDKEARQIYEMRERAMLNENTNLLGARKEGIEQGFQQGIEKGIEQGIEKGIEQGIEKGIDKATIEIAKNFKKLGISDSMISEATGLTLDQVKSLK